MNYFSNTFLTLLLLLWLGGNHAVKQLQPHQPPERPQQTLEQRISQS